MASNEKNVISSMLFQHVMMKSQRLKNQDIYLFIYIFIAVHVVKWYRTMHNKLMKRVGKLQNHLLGPAPIIHR